MAYDGSIKIDTKIDSSGFEKGISKLKGIALAGTKVIGAAITGAAALFTTAGAAAATVGTSFEAGMSRVEAISGVTGAELERLTEKAKLMGAATKFSATESAQALQYMAMAGWKSEEMLNGIDGIMSLAAADGLDLATTSDIVTDAITAFGLKAKDSSHFADVLAAASSNANTNISMLGESFKYVAPLAGAMNYSVEDVTLALGLMANAGVKSSMAGTTLKTAIANMTDPTAQMAEVMGRLGISITEASGEMKPLKDVLLNLRTGFSKLSEDEQAAAASTLFGKEAMAGMLAVINASDDDFDKLSSSISNADGTAAKMADTLQNNLQGKLTILKSSLEGLGIEIYEQMQEPLTKAADEGINAVSRLTASFKSGGLSSAIEEAGGIFGDLAVKAAIAAPKLAEASVSCIKAFADSIANNKDKIIEAAKSFVFTLANGLVRLFPAELQKPVKAFINDVKKSFESGGLKEAVNIVGNIIKNCGKIISSVAKAVLPLLSNAINLIGSEMKNIIPIATAVTAGIVAYKAVQALLSAQLTITSVAQAVLNATMSANPAMLLVAAVAALVAGLAALCIMSGDSTSATERLNQANEELASGYGSLFDGISEFQNKMDSAKSSLEGFNTELIISNEERQRLANEMSETQRAITEVARLAKDERRSLTDEEIQRLDDLFTKMQEITQRELEISQAMQEVAATQAQTLAENGEITIEEYAEQAARIMKAADETYTEVVNKADEAYTNEIAVLAQMKGTSDEYNEEWYEAEKTAAYDRYSANVEAAKRQTSDTYNILQQGYLEKSGLADGYLKEMTRLDEEERKAKSDYLQEIKRLQDEELAGEMTYNGRIAGEAEAHNKLLNEQTRIQNERQKLLYEDNTKNNLTAWLAMVSNFELYGGKLEGSAELTASAFLREFENLPDDTKELYLQAGQGMLDGLADKEPALYNKASQISNGFISRIKKVLDIHSPSRVMRKLFNYTGEGGIKGVEDKEPELEKTADNFAAGFVSRTKKGLLAGKAQIAGLLKNGVMSARYDLQMSAVNNQTLKLTAEAADEGKEKIIGTIDNKIYIGDRETAHILAPFVSEELGWI